MLLIFPVWSQEVWSLSQAARGTSGEHPGSGAKPLQNISTPTLAVIKIPNTALNLHFGQ